MKKKILIVIGHYLPGYRDGGPVRSIKNIVDRMADEFDFYILTLDRDAGDSLPYENIRYNQWNQIGANRIWYVQPGGFSCEIILQLAKGMNLVYVCGCYNDYARSVLLLKWTGKIDIPVCIAAMGLFREGAMQAGYLKKKIYLTVLRLIGAFDNILWSATSEVEVQEIINQIGKNANCYIASDLPRKYEELNVCHCDKKKGELKLLFLSRICEQKNLHLVIDSLRDVKGKVQFTIAGPKEDEEYWSRCYEALQLLPPNVVYEYVGMIESEEVVEYMRHFDSFILPSKSENYGHVIYEALLAGLIPILSDQTIWTEDIISKKIGYIADLEHIEELTNAIQILVDMNDQDYSNKKKVVLNYIKEYSDSVSVEGYRTIFNAK